MWHWIHHGLFDPLSQWEKFQYDLAGTVALIAFIIGGLFAWFAIANFIDWVNRKR